MNPMPLSTAEPPAPVRAPRKARKARPSEPQQRIVVPMPGLMPSLRQLAEVRKMPMAAIMRMAVLPLLEGGSADIDPGGCATDSAPITAGRPQQVKVNFYGRDYAELTRRARASALSRGQYLSALMAGAPPPAEPRDLSALTAQLLASNDRVAAMSVDLNAFLRVLGRVPVADLDRYRRGLQGLVADVRAHLKLAATALAEIDRARRPRW